MQAETAKLSQGLARERESMPSQKKSLLSRITGFTKDKTSSGKKPVSGKNSVKIGNPQLASMSLAMYDDKFAESKHDSSFLRGSDAYNTAVDSTNKVDHTSHNMAGPTSDHTTANTSYHTAYSTQHDTDQLVGKDADLNRSIAEFKYTSIPSPNLSPSSSLSDYQIPSLNNSITSIDWLQARFDESRSAVCMNRTHFAPKTDNSMNTQFEMQVVPSEQDSRKTNSSCNTSISSTPREFSPDQTTVCTVSSADKDDVDIYEEEFIFDDAQRTNVPSWKNSIAKLDEPTHLQDNPGSPRRMQYRTISLWRPGNFVSRAKNAQTPLDTSPQTQQRGSRYGLSTCDPSMCELTVPTAPLHTHHDTILPMMHPRYRQSWYLNARIKYLEARERTQWSSIISGLPRFLPINHS